jgi:hypothetical protein
VICVGSEDPFLHYVARGLPNYFGRSANSEELIKIELHPHTTSGRAGHRFHSLAPEDASRALRAIA